MIINMIIIVVAIVCVYLLFRFAISPLFFPDELINSTYSIDFAKLYEEGYRGVVFDIDNTLVEHGYPADERSIKLLTELDRIGFGVLFLSNNKEMRVKSFRDKALKDASYIYKAGKPGKKGYIKAMEKLGTNKDNTVFVGDQLFTDVWGAKRCGIKNILVRPINPKEEIQIVLKRRLEWIVLSAYNKTEFSKQKPHEISKNS